jgi:DNA mismatch repair ATPase MutS
MYPSACCHTLQGSCGIQVAALAGLPDNLLAAAQGHAHVLSHIMSVRQAARKAEVQEEEVLDTVITTSLAQVVQALRSTQRGLLRRRQAGQQAILAGAWVDLRGHAAALQQKKRQCIGTA